MSEETLTFREARERARDVARQAEAARQAGYEADAKDNACPSCAAKDRDLADLRAESARLTAQVAELEQVSEALNAGGMTDGQVLAGMIEADKREIRELRAALTVAEQERADFEAKYLGRLGALELLHTILNQAEAQVVELQRENAKGQR